MRLKIVFLIGFLSNTLFGGKINIAVAANVSYAINELKKEFNKLYPNTKVEVTLGSSGKLTAQIKNGAPYQIFISANMSYPQNLYKDGLATTKPIVYAQGSLAYLSTKEQNISRGVEILRSSTIKKIAVANPKTAPYGKASIEALKNAKIFDDIESKFVYGESISQTVSYTITATDIGIIAKSSLYSPNMSKYREGINWSELDPKLYKPINQGIVVLNNAEANSEVASFYTFMLSRRAKKILKSFGYIVGEI